MRRTPQTLLLLVLLSLGSAPATHADQEQLPLCPAGEVGVRLHPKRIPLPYTGEQVSQDIPSRHIGVLDLETPDGRGLRVDLVTPAGFVAVGGFTYTLVVKSPGVGVCVNPFRLSRSEIYLPDFDDADKLVEPSGSVVPLLEIEIEFPVQAGQGCFSDERDISTEEVPLRVVDAEVSGGVCRIRTYIAPA